MQLFRHNGGILTRGGALASSAACCCGGCCGGFLDLVDVLLAEVIAATNNCVPVGASVLMSPDVSATKWISDGLLAGQCFDGLQLNCGQTDPHDPNPVWTLGHDPAQQDAGCPDPIDDPAETIAVECDPFEAIFTFTLSGEGTAFCGCCDVQSEFGGGVGSVTIRVTKANP